jgi:hypothetical protein
MKKAMSVLVFLLSMAVLFSCAGDKGATGAANPLAAAAKEESAPAPGQAYDCKYFTLTVAQGWEAGPLTYGMVNVLPRGKVSPGLYFKFEGDGNAAGTAEASIAGMIKNYNGAPMTDSSIAGTVFKTTTYIYSGMTQTMHVAFRNGTKVTITIEGVNGKDNADIKAMLATVAFK